MSKFMNYAFMLIVLLIVVAYFTGTVKVVGSLGENMDRILKTLQGRDKDGNFSDYPQ
jgi:hypothetical protein